MNYWKKISDSFIEKHNFMAHGDVLIGKINLQIIQID